MKHLTSFRTITLILIGFLLTACSAPRFHPPSTQKITPYIDDQAFVMADAYRLPYRAYRPEKPKALVLALHGFNDYSRAFEGFCEAMKAGDIACYAYDQRGFGETEYHGFWPQPGQHESDLRKIVALLSQRYPSIPLFVAGESMGAAVILNNYGTALAGSNERALPNGAILLAPAVWARHTQPWYQRWALWLTVHTVPGWQPTGEGLGVQASDNIEALRALGRDPLVIKATRIDSIYGLNNLMDAALEAAPHIAMPTLVLYGEKDEVIPKEPTCAMLQAMQEEGTDFNVQLYPNGWHMLTRDLQAEVLFADVLAWIGGESLAHEAEVISRFCDNE